MRNCHLSVNPGAERAKIKSSWPDIPSMLTRPQSSSCCETRAARERQVWWSHHPSLSHLALPCRARRATWRRLGTSQPSMNPFYWKEFLFWSLFGGKSNTRFRWTLHEISFYIFTVVDCRNIISLIAIEFYICRMICFLCKTIIFKGPRLQRSASTTLLLDVFVWSLLHRTSKWQLHLSLSLYQ